MGRINATRYDKAQGNDQRALIQNEVQESVNEERAGSRAWMQNKAWTLWGEMHNKQGITGTGKRTAIKLVTDAAEVASR